MPEIFEDGGKWYIAIRQMDRKCMEFAPIPTMTQRNTWRYWNGLKFLPANQKFSALRFNSQPDAEKRLNDDKQLKVWISKHSKVPQA